MAKCDLVEFLPDDKVNKENQGQAPLCGNVCVAEFY